MSKKNRFIILVLLAGITALTSSLITSHEKKITTPKTQKKLTPRSNLNGSENETHWETITVQPNEGFSHLFKRLQIKTDNLLALSKAYEKKMPTLHPGQILYVNLSANNKLLNIALKSSETIERALIEASVKKFNRLNLAYGSIVIHQSLEEAGQKKGLSTQMIHQLAQVFRPKINFSKDLRPGDEFHFLYGPASSKGREKNRIVAAEFIGKNKSYRFIRFNYPKDTFHYYTMNGKTVNSLFLKAPVKYTRISSKFNLRRMDPIRHQIKPHLGTDFAAPTGTPIHSVGNGRITFVGRARGYGKMVIVQYTKQYKALYAHMSRFAQVKVNQLVKKGQVIGYVGQTGWATGPHLHFGFYINGKARDWLALKWSSQYTIPKAKQPQFMALASHLFKKIDFNRSMTQLAENASTQASPT